MWGLSRHFLALDPTFRYVCTVRNLCCWELGSTSSPHPPSEELTGRTGKGLGCSTEIHLEHLTKLKSWTVTLRRLKRSPHITRYLLGHFAWQNSRGISYLGCLGEALLAWLLRTTRWWHSLVLSRAKCQSLRMPGLRQCPHRRQQNSICRLMEKGQDTLKQDIRMKQRGCKPAVATQRSHTRT